MPAGCWSSWSSRPRQLASCALPNLVRPDRRSAIVEQVTGRLGVRLVTSPRRKRYSSVTSFARRHRALEGYPWTRSASHPERDRPRCRPSPGPARARTTTAGSPSTRTRPRCSTVWRPGTRTRASRCTCEDVPTPELGPGEAIVAVMASAINYNTVWTSIFEPVSTFGFLERYGRLVAELAKRHDLPYHVVGSDLAGVVLRTGPGRDHVEAGRRGRRALPVGGAGGRRRATTTRCSTRSSGSGASRPTSAAWPSWRWSRPTS